MAIPALLASPELFAVGVYASFKLCFGAQSIPGQAVRHTIMSRIQYQSAGAAVADDIGECPRFHQPPPFLSKPLMNRLWASGWLGFQGVGVPGWKASHFDYKYETCSHKYDLPFSSHHTLPASSMACVWSALNGVPHLSERGWKVKLILSQLESILTEWAKIHREKNYQNHIW